jgi:hypothetical protein
MIGIFFIFYACERYNRHIAESEAVTVQVRIVSVE